MNMPGMTIDALRTAVMALPDDALRSSRISAVEQFAKSGFPTTGHEDWKYTDLRSIIDINARWLAKGAELGGDIESATTIDSLLESIDAHWLVISNGYLLNDSLKAARDAGVEVSRLSERTPGIGLGAPMTNLNTALLRDGLHVRVSAKTKLGKPIAFLIIDHANNGARVTQARIEIELEANSMADIIEYHASSGTAEHYSNVVVELQLGNGAGTRFMRIQDRDTAHSQTTRLDVRTNSDSLFEYCGFDLGGRLVRNDLHVDIVGRGASATFHGLYLAGDGQHIDNHTRVDHRVGPANSSQEYRGILSGNCQCVWNGKAIVHAGADGTDAQQTNHNLLLSEKSEINAKPELEIYADDVKCSHGTTIGQLDEKALFYLRTRGLSRSHARQVLTRAFAGSIVNKAPIAGLHEHVAELVEKRLSEIIGGDLP